MLFDILSEESVWATAQSVEMIANYTDGPGAKLQLV